MKKFLVFIFLFVFIILGMNTQKTSNIDNKIIIHSVKKIAIDETLKSLGEVASLFSIDKEQLSEDLFNITYLIKYYKYHLVEIKYNFLLGSQCLKLLILYNSGNKKINVLKKSIIIRKEFNEKKILSELKKLKLKLPEKFDNKMPPGYKSSNK